MKRIGNMDKLLDYSVDTDSETVSFRLYDKFDISVPAKDWGFLCQKRWFTDKPSQEEVEAEFGVCGARGALDNDEANMIAKKTIETLRGFIEEDTVQECEKRLDSPKRLVGHISKSGDIYFSEADK